MLVLVLVLVVAGLLTAVLTGGVIVVLLAAGAEMRAGVVACGVIAAGSAWAAMTGDAAGSNGLPIIWRMACKKVLLSGTVPTTPKGSKT